MVTILVVMQAQQLYGQSFMCMSMPASELDKVAQMANVSLLHYVAQHERCSVCTA